MRYSTRQNCFETNSSSVHAIAIGKKEWGDFPDAVYFTCREFGWQKKCLNDVFIRASYLFTALYQLKDDNDIDYEDWRDYICSVLGKHNTKCIFYIPKEDDFYYVDHVDQLKDWLAELRGSETLLTHFLFSSDSFVKTGNDNVGSRPYVEESDSYLDVYVKGN